MIKVEGLSKKFSVHTDREMIVEALEEVSFEIKEGEFLGITGPSGAGKSSILKCLYRTYLPTSGQIWYQSSQLGLVDLAKLEERKLLLLRSTEIGYVSQFLKVIPRVSALDIVSERLLPLGFSLEQAKEEGKIILARLGITTDLWNSYPATFSGGEQQRINLARALISKPKFLILDEPTASLDKENKIILLNMLKELKAQGTAMVGVFHDWEVMGTIADQVLNVNSLKEKKWEVGSRNG